MSDFDLLKKAMLKCKEEKPVLPPVSSKTLQKSCPHENILNDKGTNVCIDCGEEVEVKISVEKEWRAFGQTESKEIDRLQSKKVDERGIFKDVEGLGFSDKIINKANSLYKEVSKNQIFRGLSRKAIIFACVYNAYKSSDKPQSHTKLTEIFGLQKKLGLKGIKYFNLNFPREKKIVVAEPDWSENTSANYTTPANLVEEIMDDLNATTEQKNEVISLYNKIKGKSSKINRSRPRSVGAALVFYWLRENRSDIELKDFAKKVGLSELTITKNRKEITRILSEL